MRNYGFPPKFITEEFGLDESLFPFLPPQLRQTDTRGLCLTGTVGVGKTMAMALLVREWLRKRVVEVKSKEAVSYGPRWGASTQEAWRFISYPAFVMELQDRFRKTGDEDTTLDLLKQAAVVPHLILDDLGVEKPTDFVRQSTYYLINEREMNCQPTYITTNFSLDKLNEQLDPRISSRIAGMCAVRELKGNDRRVKRR